MMQPQASITKKNIRHWRRWPSKIRAPRRGWLARAAWAQQRQLGALLTAWQPLQRTLAQAERLGASLAETEAKVRRWLTDCEDVSYRPLTSHQNCYLLIYLNGMVDKEQLEQRLLPELQAAPAPAQDLQAFLDWGHRWLTISRLETVVRRQDALRSLMAGDALLLCEGVAGGLLLDSRQFVKRSITDAQSEGALRGPHDAFIEAIADNLTLIRRRTRDADLKVRLMKVGVRTQTDIALVYIDSLVKPGLVATIEQRLQGIYIDRVLLVTNIEEFLVEHPWSPFPQTQSVERPERVVAALYEGRVAIVVDNTPYVLLIPCTYNSLMQTTDDYVFSPPVTTLVRVSRHISAALAIFLPALYIAIVSYHPGMMPTTLAISIAELRARTPFPSFLEAVLMEILLELFQEAVVRLPSKLSAAASMVGAFVIGNTVVQAGLVNPLLVVVIAATAIFSFAMPSFLFSMALRWLRVPMLVLASVFGLYGIMLGAICLLIHLCALRNFGESYLGGLFNLDLWRDWQDTLLRAPLVTMQQRPKEYGAQDRQRKEKTHGET